MTLVVAIVCGLQGLHLVLYLTLPYVLVQQSIYAAWLLGGGSLVLSVLRGLVGAGLLLGPTLYCAGLCPTGATLGTLGSARSVHLRVLVPPSCGAHCTACNSVCWLQLQPRKGDPGPECDLCARCVPTCLRSNLRVVVELKSKKPVLAKAATLLFVLTALCPTTTRAEGTLKPTIVVERELQIGEATVATSAVDVDGTTLHRDWDVPQRGTDIQVYFTRGVLQKPGPLGVIKGRPFYTGPLTIELKTPGRQAVPLLNFDRVNHPISAQRPSIYQRRVPVRLHPGDTLAAHPLAGYFMAFLSAALATLCPELTSGKRKNLSFAAWRTILSAADLGSRLLMPGFSVGGLTPYSRTGVYALVTLSPSRAVPGL